LQNILASRKKPPGYVIAKEIKVKIETHILAYNGAEIFIYAARHYATFANRIILHDLGSTDGTLDIAAQFGIEVRQWDCKNEVNNLLHKQIKEQAWRGTDSDWVIVADTDELLYFPNGVADSFNSYSAQGLPVVKPHGFEMFSETFPVTEGQIYDEVKFGARDDRWYAKPVVFSPKLVESIQFTAGAHECWATLKSGAKFDNPTRHSEPPAYLLHFHHIHPLEILARNYDDRLARKSEVDKKNRWGNFEPGIKHALDKRAYITGRLERVIA
jgi:hypothetical protein